MKNRTQMLITTITGMLSALLGALYIPVLLLVACNIIDYITGLMAAPYRKDGGISSYKSIRGITKKISMWVLVVVGSLMDQMLAYTVNVFGWTSPAKFLIACLVAIWLICNEMISILENVQDVGIVLPKWMLPLVKHIKSQADNSVDVEEAVVNDTCKEDKFGKS